MQNRVYFAKDPTVFGTVIEVCGEEARVVWDDGRGGKDGLWYDISKLRSDSLRKSNPPEIYAPEIQDLEYTTRIHPISHSLVMERDEGYRGNSGPEILEALDVYDLFQHMSELDQEHILILLLDIHNRLMGWKVVHKGLLSSVEVSLRDVLKDALLANAARLVLVHNHPSGDPDPSDDDANLTEAVARSAGDLGIELFDHVVIGRQQDGDPDFLPFYSFRDEGRIIGAED